MIPAAGGAVSEMTMLGTLVSRPDGPRAHRFPVPVYWEDTDAGGIVYYANYLKFTERARTDLLRGLGINQQALMEAAGLTFVVRACDIEYLQPARMDDMLVVETSLCELKGASLRMRQDVWREDICLVRSAVRIACLDKSGKPARFSPQIRDKFASIIDRES